MANGVCSFFHRGIGVQNPGNQERQPQSQTSYPNKTSQQPTRRWCKFLKDCDRVPNSAFSHYEEDFPKLRKTNNPPIANRGWGWEEYLDKK